MKVRTYISFIILFLYPYNRIVASQSDTIVVNTYSKVIKVFDRSNFGPDSVQVSDASSFKDGDTIIIHQSKGVNWIYDQEAENGYGMAGRFEFHVIARKLSGNILIMRGQFTKKSGLGFDVNAGVQIVRVPSYKNKLNINKTITAPAWDSTKGGIVAIIADTIELNANIDVSKKGFHGGDPSGDLTNGICWSSDTVKLKAGNFSKNAKDSAGFKGESAVIFNNDFLRGNMPLYSGGGGGNGYMSGGGGGSNYGSGGNGGYEADHCLQSFDSLGGRGGMSLASPSILSTNDAIALFGGGGGAGTQVIGYHSAKGGAGGGIVIIMANVIIGNNNYIIANGQSVTDTCSGAGGGGGGGGAIIVNALSYIGVVKYYATGGNGGWTNKGGPGGGGGGGYVRYDGTSLNAYVDHSFTKPGKTYLPQNKAVYGNPGDAKGNLVMPVRDFLFNLMPENQEICEDETPKRIDASIPKGGTGNYQFSWLKSTDGISWVTVSTDTFYQPPALNKTTLYRRAVIDVGNVPELKDTSAVDSIKVLPRIINNSIFTDTTTICKGLRMPLMLGNKVTDTKNTQNRKYYYYWQDSTLTDITNANDTSYSPSTTNMNYFRRVVKSGVCTSYSNTLKINVLDSISDNLILKNQWVSQGVTANPLFEKTKLRGGDNNYIYSWEQSKNKTDWTVSLDNKADTAGYKVPNFADTITISFRRIVLSGDKHICKSISNIVTIKVLETIKDNNIFGSDTICGNTVPRKIKGKKSTGGDNLYSYQWLKSNDNQHWDSLTVVVGDTLFNPGVLLSSIYYKRIVLSGPGYCCRDTSSSIFILVKPFIKFNDLLQHDTIICYNQTIKELTASAPDGGDGPYSYIWQTSDNLTKWDTAKGEALTPSYHSPLLFDSVYIRRKIVSGVCTDYSDTIKITVLPAITNNVLLSEKFVCKGNVPDPLLGSEPTGGNNTYTYKWVTINGLQWIGAAGKLDSIHYQPGETSDETQYKRVVFSGLVNCCVDTSNTLTLKIHELPTASFDLDSGKVCLGSEYLIPISFSGKANFNIKINDGIKDSLYVGISSTSTQLSVIPLQAKGYNYIITSLIDGNNCVAKPLTSNEFLQVYKVPVANAGHDTSVCGLDVKLSALPTVGKGFWSTSAEATYKGGRDKFDAIANVLEYGTHEFTWLENNGGCSSSAKINVTFFEKPINPIAGNDSSTAFLFKTKLNGKAPDLSYGVWSSPDESIKFEDVYKPTSEVEGLKFGENIFIWSVKNGVCEELRDTVVLTNLDLKIPNGFSPHNGDDINPVFKIGGLENQTGAELYILNRWGTEVYHSKDYKNDWDGTHNSVDLPMDTYFYILRVIGRTYKGYVVIRR